MRHLGADIREIALPVEKVTAGVRQTLSSLGWRIVEERASDDCLMIRAAGTLSGGLAFRVASGRQLVEWRLGPASAGHTRLETHYGIDPRFRRRFWCALVLLVLILPSLFYRGYKERLSFIILAVWPFSSRCCWSMACPPSTCG